MVAGGIEKDDRDADCKRLEGRHSKVGDQKVVFPDESRESIGGPSYRHFVGPSTGHGERTFHDRDPAVPGETGTNQ